MNVRAQPVILQLFSLLLMIANCFIRLQQQVVTLRMRHACCEALVDGKS